MKKIFSKIKNIKEWSLFAKIVTGYMVVLAVAIIAICVWEWNALADYEADNQAAKKNSNPEVFFEQYIEDFTLEKYKALIGKSLEESGNIFYTTEMLINHISESYNAGKITGKKNEKWTETRPAYDIYAGEDKLLTLTLGVKSKDDFGYNVWKEGQIQLADQLVFDQEVSLIVDSTMVVTINGVQVTTDYIENHVNTDAVNARMEELMGSAYTFDCYEIKNLLADYELKVTDSAGNELDYTEIDGIRDYTKAVADGDKDSVVTRVVDTMEAYAKIINKVINRSNMTKYFHPDGPLYEVFGSEQFKESMYWNFAANSIEFVREDVTNIRMVSDEIMICDINFEANKTYDRKYNVNENLLHEVFCGEAIFVQKDGQWYLDTLKLQ